MSSLSTSLVIPGGDLQVAIDFYIKAFSSKAKVLTGLTPISPDFSNATIQIYGHKFTMFSMGPDGVPSPATSFMITCHDGQSEVDSIWDGLTTNGGEEQRCGWVKDRFGFFWQIVPKELGELMTRGEKESKGRVMQAMLGMKKLDIAGLEKAAAGD